MRTVILYSLFAAISIVINILAQELSLWVYSDQYSILISVFMGTGAGLVSKFFLDKIFVFKDSSESISDDVGKFVNYTGTGVITTLIFWGFEFGFELLFGTKTARYSGAVIGLTIGYVLKYQLDNRYVFNKEAS